MYNKSKGIEFDERELQIYHDAIKSRVINYEVNYLWIFDIVLNANHKYYGKNRIRLDYSHLSNKTPNSYTDIYGFITILINNYKYFEGELKFTEVVDVKKEFESLWNEEKKIHLETKDFYADERESWEEEKRNYLDPFRLDNVAGLPKPFEEQVFSNLEINLDFREHYINNRTFRFFHNEVWLTIFNESNKRLFPAAMNTGLKEKVEKKRPLSFIEYLQIDDKKLFAENLKKEFRNENPKTLALLIHSLSNRKILLLVDRSYTAFYKAMSIYFETNIGSDTVLNRHKATLQDTSNNSFKKDLDSVDNRVEVLLRK